MRRSIETWANCDPKAMAYNQSAAAVQFALEDARADILELHADMLRFKNIARAIAYPQRGTHEETYGLTDFIKLIQSAYSAEDLWVEPADR
jgi:hypothetical protein